MCGRAISADAMVCPRCGRQLGPFVSPVPQEPKEGIAPARQTRVSERAPARALFGKGPSSIEPVPPSAPQTQPAESTRAVISKRKTINIRNLVAGIVVGFIDGVLIGNLATVFSTSAGGALAFLSAWVLVSYLIYRYPQPRIAIGSIVLCLGILCLLIPMGFFVVGSRMGGFGVLAGGLGAIAFALILGPLGLVLALIGFWLVSQGLRRLRTTPVSKQPRPVVGRFCTFCGAQMSAQGSFCPNCGARQPQV